MRRREVFSLRRQFTCTLSSEWLNDWTVLSTLAWRSVLRTVCCYSTTVVYLLSQFVLGILMALLMHCLPYIKFGIFNVRARVLVVFWRHSTMIVTRSVIFFLTFRNLASHIWDGHKITLYMPHFIFIQQISVLIILNVLYNLHFFLFKMPFIS